MNDMYLKIVKPDKLRDLYIKILKKEASEIDFMTFKYNVEISCMATSLLFMKLNREAHEILGEEFYKIYDPKIEQEFKG